jgi:putative spermidine/putrescine transport system permease protein
VKAGWLPTLCSLVLAAFLVLPTFFVFGSAFTSGELLAFPPKGLSLRWFEAVVNDESLIQAFRNSAVVAVLSAAVAMLIGTALAFSVSRGRGVWRSVVTVLAVAPMVIPLVVVALGFYYVYVRHGLTGNVRGMVLAHGLLGMPYVFINSLAALDGADRHIEEAARVSGASPARAFLLVTLPLIAPSVIVGGLLAFILSWDELIVSLFLVTPDFRTVPVEMWGELQQGNSPTTSAVAAIVTSTSLLVLGLVSAAPLMIRRLSRRGSEGATE